MHIEQIEIEGAVCPNCGARTMWPIALGRVQCRTCLKSMDREVIIKEAP